MACNGCNEQPINIALDAVIKAAQKTANETNKIYVVTKSLTIQEYDPEATKTYEEIIMPDTTAK